MKEDISFQNQPLIWKPIKNYEGLYEINQFGEVKSVSTLVSSKNNKSRRKRERIIGQWKTNMGYVYVNLSKEGKQKKFTVHRLVAAAFIPNTENKPIVNHLNADLNDNRACNLEWCDQSHNLRHAVKLNRKPSVGSKPKKVIDLCSGREYKTSKEAAKFHGMTQNRLSRILNGKVVNKTCLQFAA